MKKRIILYVLSLSVMTMVAAISATSFAAVLYSFFGINIKMAVFAGALFATPFYIINFKMGNKLGYEIKEWRNRYIDYAIKFVGLPYETQEIILDSYLKGETNVYFAADDISKLKAVTYKLFKKPLIYVEPDGRATFTLLKACSGVINHPIPYLIS